MRILISGGGTREPIDGVRFITNFSTGVTAAALADYFTARGVQVTCLMAEGGMLPRDGARVVSFTTFASLDQAFRDEIARERVDAILHLAAVSDYSVDSIWEGDRKIELLTTGKLDSRGEITLKLKPNFKIVQRLKKYALDAGYVQAPRLVAFKLTDSPHVEERRRAVDRLFADSDADLVVHNDLGDRRAGTPLFTVSDRKAGITGKCHDARALGATLAEQI